MTFVTILCMDILNIRSFHLSNSVSTHKMNIYWNISNKYQSLQYLFCSPQHLHCSRYAFQCWYLYNIRVKCKFCWYNILVNACNVCAGGSALPCLWWVLSIDAMELICLSPVARRCRRVIPLYRTMRRPVHSNLKLLLNQTLSTYPPCIPGIAQIASIWMSE